MKKKILILATDFPPNFGGVATYSWELAQSLSSKDFQVEVVTRKANYPEQNSFKILGVKLPQSGLLCIIPLTLFLRKMLQKKSFDHVYCTLWLPEAVAFWLARKTLRLHTPYHIAVHGMEILESDSNWKKKIRKKLSFLKLKVFNDAQTVFCVSHFSKNKLMNLLPIADEKVKVVHNGANPKIFKLNPDLKKQPPFSLLTACRLQKNKGVDQVLMALPRVLEKFPSLTYRVVGDGPEMTNLKELVANLNISKSVIFLGRLKQNQLIQEMNQADLFVMLSREEDQFVEGFGLVFLEAALCGTASLGGRSGGIPDAIFDNETGWLVSPENTDEISQKLIEILSLPDHLVQVSHQAMKKTLESRTWSHQVDQIISHGGL